jgi:hypothetical protein
LVCETRTQSLSATFSYTLYTNSRQTRDSNRAPPEQKSISVSPHRRVGYESINESRHENKLKFRKINLRVIKRTIRDVVTNCNMFMNQYRSNPITRKRNCPIALIQFITHISVSISKEVTSGIGTSVTRNRCHTSANCHYELPAYNTNFVYFACDFISGRWRQRLTSSPKHRHFTA